MFSAHLDKHPAKTRDAYLQVPVEGGTALRMRVEVALSMFITTEDTMSFEGNGFEFKLRLVDFEDQDGLLEATTTDWGAATVVDVPAKAFSIWSQPVRVSYGPATRNVLVAVLDNSGNVLASSSEAFWLQLTAERPQEGTCSLLLKPTGPSAIRDVRFTWLKPWELDLLRDTKALEQDQYDIWYQYPVPSSCGVR